jgi:hypothetical protein
LQALLVNVSWQSAIVGQNAVENRAPTVVISGSGCGLRDGSS